MGSLSARPESLNNLSWLNTLCQNSDIFKMLKHGAYQPVRKHCLTGNSDSKNSPTGSKRLPYVAGQTVSVFRWATLGTTLGYTREKGGGPPAGTFLLQIPLRSKAEEAVLGLGEAETFTPRVPLTTSRSPEKWCLTARAETSIPTRSKNFFLLLACRGSTYKGKTREARFFPS